MSRVRTTKRENKQKFWVRIVCIVLCVLLAGGTVVSVLFALL